MDLVLLPELGAHGQNRQAVALGAAVAAALAHGLVDDDVTRWLGSRPRLRRRRASAADCWS